MIAWTGYGSSSLPSGIARGIVLVLLALFLAAPRPGRVGAARPAKVRQSGRDYYWTEMIRSPIFWVMYVMFVLVGAGGLMATAQLAPIAKDWGIDKTPVSLIGITLPALTFALSIDRILYRI